MVVVVNVVVIIMMMMVMTGDDDNVQWLMVLLKVIGLRDSGGMVPETFLQVFLLLLIIINMTIIDPHNRQHQYQYISG